MLYAAITENDESQWEDEPGVRYHFPRTYAKYLPPGTLVVYYKGAMKNSAFAASRLSKFPHYFAFARIEILQCNSRGITAMVAMAKHGRWGKDAQA